MPYLERIMTQSLFRKCFMKLEESYTIPPYIIFSDPWYPSSALMDWGRGMYQKTRKVSGTSPSHRVHQAVDGGLWNVVTLLFNGCVKLLDSSRNTLSYTLIQCIPNMFNGWHIWWVCKLWKYWDIFSFQELCTVPCDMRSSCIMLKHEVMVAN
jgi:hypothetical protein